MSVKLDDEIEKLVGAEFMQRLRRAVKEQAKRPLPILPLEHDEICGGFDADPNDD